MDGSTFASFFYFYRKYNTLPVKDVKDKTHIVLTEKKTGKMRRFKINHYLLDEIEKYIWKMNDEDYLFPSRNNKGKEHLKRIMAYNIMNNVAKEVGLDEIGCHTMRKTFGYHFYNKTKDVAILQRLFNHSSPSVTLRYIGINQDRLDDAILDFHL